MASILVESMKRLYQDGKITKENVSARIKSGKITEDEYEYITGEAYEEQADRGHRGAGKDHRDAVRENQEVIGTACKLHDSGRTGQNGEKPEERKLLSELIYQTYIIALPIILTALMGYIVWLLKNQKKDRDANEKGRENAESIIDAEQTITDMDLQNIETEQTITDMDLRIMELEGKNE